jgi:hypothetical protein
MNFDTGLEPVFGRISEVSDARIESRGGGGKRDGKNDREPKRALYIITKESQAKNSILYLAGVTFGGQGRVKVCLERGAFTSAG